MIKLSLKQLIGLFVQSAANEEIPKPIRQFAAQLTVLTKHLELEVVARQKLAGQLQEITDFLLSLNKDHEQQPATQPAPAGATAAAPQVDEEEDETQAMVDKITAETEAEVAAIANGSQAVTPMRKPVKKVAPAEGGAA